MKKVWDPRDPGFHGKQCGKDQKIVWLKRKRKRKEKKEKKEEKKKREKKEEKKQKRERKRK